MACSGGGGDTAQMDGVGLLYKIRTDNRERFLTMIKMHLSIYTNDLTNDELDAAVSYWNELGDERFVVNSGSHCEAPFGCPLTQEGIAVMHPVVQFLAQPHVLATDGLFRKSGVKARQELLKRRLMRGETVNVAAAVATDGLSLHDVAAVLKEFMRTLPEPLLTTCALPVYLNISDFTRTKDLSKSLQETADAKRLNAVRLLMLLLPPENQQFAKMILELLHKAADTPENPMDSEALATCLLPCFFGQQQAIRNEMGIGVEDAGVLYPILDLMIRSDPEALFVPPQPLIDDAVQYYQSGDVYKDACDRGHLYAETPSPMRRSKVKTPLRPMSDTDLEARTTITFAQQSPATMASTSASTTELELAKLMAHIQEMPDGQKKEELLMKIQKQNRYHSSTKNARGTGISRFGKRLTQVFRGVPTPRSWHRFDSSRSLPVGSNLTVPKQSKTVTSPNRQDDNGVMDVSFSSVAGQLGSSSHLTSSISGDLRTMSIDPSQSAVSIGPFEYSVLPEPLINLDTPVKKSVQPLTRRSCMKPTNICLQPTVITVNDDSVTASRVGSKLPAVDEYKDLLQNQENIDGAKSATPSRLLHQMALKETLI